MKLKNPNSFRRLKPHEIAKKGDICIWQEDFKLDKFKSNEFQMVDGIEGETSEKTDYLIFRKKIDYSIII